VSVVLAFGLGAVVAEALEAAGCDADGDEFAVPEGYDLGDVSRCSKYFHRPSAAASR
jgi:hypothetical protein